MSDCLLITSLADEFAEAIGRSAGPPISVTACRSAEEALERYNGESVLFGNPQQIADILADLPAVRWVQSSWAGVTPLIAHARRDYVLTGVKDVFGPQMAEYVLGYLLNHELRIFERQLKQTNRDWFPALSGTLSGKALGVLGTGSIGHHIAKTAAAFGMQVRGLNRTGRGVDGFGSVFASEDILGFLDGLHYVVSALPQTTGTDRLLDASALSQLPAHAVFVNIGRANVVDTEALVAALEAQQLAAAVLDVFDEEPLPADSTLWDTRGLLLTSHISAVSHPALIVPIFVENFRRFNTGAPLHHVVDFDAGY
ncbi:MAG: D-2-hydroxyacid dehydrogenase [Pseudomonadota bacterium]